MLYDFSCTPQLFTEEALNSDSSNFFFLQMFLKEVNKNGILADLNNGDWRKQVLQQINSLQPSHKDKLLHLLSNLKDHNLIVGHKKAELKPSSEEEWIELAKISDDLEPFFSMLSLSKNDKTISLQSLFESDKWQDERLRTHYIIQNEVNLLQELKPILSYAKKVILIDPYFDTIRPKYRATLNIVAQELRSQRGNAQKGTIEIHTRFKYGETDGHKFKSSWERSSKEIFQKYGHICRLYQWDKTDSWHDRYIITDQCGVHVGAGLDVREEGKSTWAKLEYSTLSDIVKDFRENSSSYELKLSL
ncbi:hypothetical protein [Sulfurimonas sp.]|jgi:hypothetical protein|uniref:hypothetical protein n=1 Tax=Sulfurimonas sp. TaxID=2022749 RepID=UPI0025CE1C3E|nr:hypothetical protein [Sulfurimonas sp.]MBT5935429.1 hypothetical protein [Sulfurimonas sp.]